MDPGPGLIESDNHSRWIPSHRASYWWRHRAGANMPCLYIGNSVYITSAIRAPVTWRSLLSTLKIGYQNAFATSYTTPIFPWVALEALFSNSLDIKLSNITWKSTSCRSAAFLPTVQSTVDIVHRPIFIPVATNAINIPDSQPNLTIFPRTYDSDQEIGSRPSWPLFAPSSPVFRPLQ